MNEPVLLMTGGRGFVGRRLAEKFVDLFPGHRRVMVARSAQGAVPDGWEIETLDLTDSDGVRNLVRLLRPSVVFHSAAQTSVGAAILGGGQTWRVNTVSTFVLAEAVRDHAPGGVFFFTSSGDVYGDGLRSGHATEAMLATPLNAYAVSKLAAEGILRDILPRETQLLITRAFNHSGAGQEERFVLSSFAGQIARAEEGVGPTVIQVGDLSAERDFLHVDDVVDAYVQLLTSRLHLPQRLIVNIASGRAERLADLLEQLCERARIPITLSVDPSRLRPADIPQMIGDASALRALVGWAPQRAVSDILDDLLQWHRENLKKAALQNRAPPPNM